ncbi:AAA family ATPase [Ceratobasidium sp. AG-Ba]|nr:AAA family ATPase [Ceratobasidium sp. AG-Ba]
MAVQFLNGLSSYFTFSSTSFAVESQNRGYAAESALKSDVPSSTSSILLQKIQIWDQTTSDWKDKPLSFKVVDGADSSAKVVAYTRKDASHPFKDHIWVEFRSEPLAELIKPYFPNETGLMGLNPGIDARRIYNRRKVLRTVVETDGAAETPDDAQKQPVEDLKTLLDYVDKAFEDVTMKLKAAHDGGTCVEWNMLWAIFADTDFVETPDSLSAQPIAFRLQEWTYNAEEPTFEVHGKHLQWTGRRYVHGRISRQYERFDGARSLHEIGVKPLTEERRHELSSRGKLYIQRAGDAQHLYYRAHIIRQEFNPMGGCPVAMKEPAEGRVMVDVMSHRRMNPNFDFWDQEDILDDGSKRSDWRTSLNEDDPEIHLLPPTLGGWSFAAKQWGHLLVEHLSPIPFAADSFEHLVIPEESKEMIKSLVEAQAGSGGATLMNDLVPGKGTGSVFLLHGNPADDMVFVDVGNDSNDTGTGKTLTAEAIADHLRLPLYTVSCCEFGTEVPFVEMKLKHILEITSLWKAVVLIDEADIFLEARSTDLARNAVVGVFLRMLEYHSGIVIMTTNRVHTLDQAFKSRISLALKYHDLDLTSRKILWEKFLGRAGAVIQGRNGGVDNFTFSLSDIESLAAKETNGRVIKHLVRTSQALAFRRKEPLSPAHIAQVWKMIETFENDLNNS